MKIQTKNPITFYPSVGMPQIGIVECKIGAVNAAEEVGKVIEFTYSSEGIIIKRGKFEIPKEDIQALYGAVSADLPPDSDYNIREWTMYYKGCAIEMVKSYEDLTDISQLTIIEE